jgi:hypothetical protein
MLVAIARGQARGRAWLAHQPAVDTLADLQFQLDAFRTPYTVADKPPWPEAASAAGGPQKSIA